MVMTLNRTEKDADENRAELFIPKNREGKSGRVFRLHLNNGIPKLTIDSYFDSVSALQEQQKNQYIPPPESELARYVLDNKNNK